MGVNPPGSTGTQASPRPPDTVAPVNCRHPPAGHSQSPHTSTIRDPFLSHPQGITQHWEHCLVPCRVNGTRHTGTTAWVRMFHGFESHCSQPPQGLLGFRPRTLVLRPSFNRALPLHRGPSGPVPAQAQERRCVFAPGPLKRAAVLLIHTAVPTPGPAHARFMATP